MEEVTINVKGMKGGGCSKMVEDGLKTLPGVSAAVVDLKGAKVKVSLDKAKPSVEQVRQKIGDTAHNLLEGSIQLQNLSPCRVISWSS